MACTARGNQGPWSHPGRALQARVAAPPRRCWDPGCNAGAKGAERLAALGFRVKEMIGGFEYWKRNGYPIGTGS